eukprot:6493950-Pyramimonas_sp.AAC.1
MTPTRRFSIASVIFNIPCTVSVGALGGIANPLWSGPRGSGTKQRTILRTRRCATGTPCFGTGRTRTH